MYIVHLHSCYLNVYTVNVLYLSSQIFYFDVISICLSMIQNFCKNTNNALCVKLTFALSALLAPQIKHFLIITREGLISTLSICPILQGVDQKILPCGQGRIDSVKINPSLLMMRECSTHLHIVILLHYIGTHCCLVWLETNVRQGIFLASALCKLCAPCALCKPCALCRAMCTM